MLTTREESRLSNDSHAQLRVLYMSLLQSQEHFDEFKHLLALYEHDVASGEPESEEATKVRTTLNERIRHWTGKPIDGLTVAQVLQWRAIVVEERINVCLSPWKEANAY